MIATVCLAMAAAQCDTATADTPCCGQGMCRPVGVGCADGWTDCGAKCTVAFSQEEQRRCADGGYARLIGNNCDACPEDARATTDGDTEKKGLSAEAIGAIVGGSIGGVVLLAVSYAVCRARRDDREESLLA